LPLLVSGLVICLAGSARAGMISYWNFDSTAGTTVADQVPGSTHDGTLIGSAGITTGNQGVGGSGEALTTNGWGNLTAGDPTSYNFSASFTWYVCVKGWDDGGDILSRRPATGDANQGSKFLLVRDNEVTFSAQWLEGIRTGRSLGADWWQQVIVTYDDSTDHFSIFKNGTELALTGAGGTHPNQTYDINTFSESVEHNGGFANTAFRIGSSSFTSLIDDVAVFDEALTGEDLTTLMSSGPTAFLTAVPEPSTLVGLSGMGAVGLLFARRRRRPDSLDDVAVQPLTPT